MIKQKFNFNPETLDFTPVSKKSQFIQNISIIVSIIATIAAITSFTTYEKIDPTKLTESEVILVLEHENKFTPEKLQRLLTKLNFVHSDIVYAQAVQETGRFTSTIFKENNNLFGMKVANQRCTTNQGVSRGHAKYNTWTDSVIDYAMYQSKYTSRFTREQYFQYLEKYYAEDPTYVKRLRTIIKRLN